MRIESADLISKTTETSARTLSALSAASFAASYYGLNSTAWNFIEDKAIEPQAFREIVTAVLLFLLVGHCLHWVGDFRSYKNWFKRAKVAKDSIGDVGSIENTEHPSSALRGRVERLVSAIDRRLEEIKSQGLQSGGADDRLFQVETSVTEIAGRVKEISILTEEFSAKFHSVNSVAFVTVVGWYLAVPVLLSLAAIISLWCVEIKAILPC